MSDTLLNELHRLTVPPDLTAWTAVLLIGVNFVTSAFTATVGLGGGVANIAVMANFLPAASVIPIHAVVQVGNNASRTVLNRKNVVWHLAGWFTLGALVGAGIASLVVVALPRPVLQLILGIFVLYSVFGPKPKNLTLGKAGIVIGGVVTTFATFFVGATGPLVAAVMPVATMVRHQVVATHGALMTFQHALKIVFFGMLGFQFLPWLGFLAAMMIAGFLGTYVGRMLLGRMPEAFFKKLFYCVLVLLALRLIYAGIAELLA